MLVNPEVKGSQGIENEKALNAEANKPSSEKPILRLKVSKASFFLDEVTGFIYGGTSSRFWLLRKHICSKPPDDFKNLPFFSWECLSIVLKDRLVDLVIKNQEHMNMLLKLLIHNLNTINGELNSAKDLK